MSVPARTAVLFMQRCCTSPFSKMCAAMRHGMSVPARTGGSLFARAKRKAKSTH